MVSGFVEILMSKQVSFAVCVSCVQNHQVRMCRVSKVFATAKYIPKRMILKHKTVCRVPNCEVIISFHNFFRYIIIKNGMSTIISQLENLSRRRDIL